MNTINDCTGKKRGNRNCTDEFYLNTIERFKPLIKKYSKKLQYDCAETDLIITIIKILKNMPYINDEKAYISYIAKSVKNEYVRLSKKEQLTAQREVPMELEAIPGEESDMEIKIDLYQVLVFLNSNQKKVIELNYFLNYSDSEIAAKLNISRQAVNKTKRKALEVIRQKLIS